MPRAVDRDQRVREIVDAAVGLLAEDGYRELTLRKLATRMGGSITLVTHYFANRDELLNGVMQTVVSESVAFTEELAGIEDPHQRLREVLLWFLPLTEGEQRTERARLALVVQSNVSPVVVGYGDELEDAMRRVVRRAVQDLVPAERLDGTVELVRVWTRGMVLSVIEHPESWPERHQIEAMERFLRTLESGLGLVLPTGHGH
ncbi:TetR/AcrR family transcriptional regulator [Kitasatospora cineracea]|uniref:TetR family transcriptional regulator n=1 Tax=Kitasatospora cineracea TaxID=88074 RepID=A0A8G1UM36_9ACTN|nr:TetR/AcrR family transcriptional regulator [Kitasatospora cineracea]ROR46512.1 TetR family transcriptional regulator [Kitasatospora cineracea]